MCNSLIFSIKTTSAICNPDAGFHSQNMKLNKCFIQLLETQNKNRSLSNILGGRLYESNRDFSILFPPPPYPLNMRI